MLESLPQELVVHIIAQARLEHLLVLGECSKTLKQLIGQDARWLPIIPPPTLAHTTLTIAAHGQIMVLLFARYRRWLHNCYLLDLHSDTTLCNVDELCTQNTALDGFFAIEPWHRNPNEPLQPGAWAPLAWLQRLVYGPQPPPRAEQGLLGGRRHSSRLKERSADDDKSLYYQQRERDEEDVFRSWYTIPCELAVAKARQATEMVLGYSLSKRLAIAKHGHPPRNARFVVQPLNLRAADGSIDPRLPDLSDAAIMALHTSAEALLRCYFPAGDSFEVRPTCQHTINTNRDVRRDQGNPIYQVSVRALRDHDCCVLRPPEDSHTFTAFVIAPHLRPDDKDLAWVFSSPVFEDEDYEEEDDDETGYWSPWCLSTFQSENHLAHSSALARRVLLGNVLYCLLGAGAGLDVCENSPCVLNCVLTQWVDSVGEAAARSLLLCPCCLRKMQAFGFVHDVPACLKGLHAVLNTPALVGVSARDLATLREWGYGNAGSSSEPVVVPEE